jgi:hypothetical protein
MLQQYFSFRADLKYYRYLEIYHLLVLEDMFISLVLGDISISLIPEDMFMSLVLEDISISLVLGDMFISLVLGDISLSLVPGDTSLPLVLEDISLSFRCDSCECTESSRSSQEVFSSVFSSDGLS